MAVVATALGSGGDGAGRWRRRRWVMAVAATALGGGGERRPPASSICPQSTLDTVVASLRINCCPHHLAPLHRHDGGRRSSKGLDLASISQESPAKTVSATTAGIC
ncbi:hypothetical protein U1Q18_038666 [Sarracenia purpurea var. burkii]